MPLRFNFCLISCLFPVSGWRHASILPFRYSTIPLFRHSAIPPFRYSAIPLFCYFAIPLFCHSAIPPFRYSTIPPFHHSAIPPFHYSAIPPFRYSAIPPFRHSAVSPGPSVMVSVAAVFEVVDSVPDMSEMSFLFRLKLNRLAVTKCNSDFASIWVAHFEDINGCF